MEENLAKICNALGNETRLRLVMEMSTGCMGTCCDKISCEEQGISVADAVAFTGLAQSTVSQHLIVLEHAGILRREKRSQWTVFQLNRDLLDRFCVQISQALQSAQGSA